MSELYNHECQLNSETKRRCPYCEENICKQPVNHQTCIMKESDKAKKQYEEQVLPDDYPVFWDYFYVADSEVIVSDIQGIVLDLKRNLTERGISCKEIKNCDLAGRGII